MFGGSSMAAHAELPPLSRYSLAGAHIPMDNHKLLMLPERSYKVNGEHVAKVFGFIYARTNTTKPPFSFVQPWEGGHFFDTETYLDYEEGRVSAAPLWLQDCTTHTVHYPAWRKLNTLIIKFTDGWAKAEIMDTEIRWIRTTATTGGARRLCVAPPALTELGKWTAMANYIHCIPMLSDFARNYMCYKEVFYTIPPVKTSTDEMRREFAAALCADGTRQLPSWFDESDPELVGLVCFYVDCCRSDHKLPTGDAMTIRASFDLHSPALKNYDQITRKCQSFTEGISLRGA